MSPDPNTSARTDESGLESVRHVFVIGNSGSGKSTYAAALGAQLKRPVLALDHHAFVAGTPKRRPLEDSLAAIRDEIEDRPHIIEGCYADLVAGLARKADHLIWLDLPVETCLAHARARPFEPDKWPTKEAQDAFLPKLLDFIAQYPTDEGPTGRQVHEKLYVIFPGTREWRTRPELQSS